MVGTGIFPVPPLKGGGVEMHIFCLMKELAKLGHEVHYVGGISNTNELNGIKLHEVDVSRSDEPLKLEYWIPRAVKAEIGVCRKSFIATKKINFDIIHIHEVRGNIPGLFLSFLKSAPTVFTIHGLTPWMHKFNSFLEGKLRKLMWFISDLQVLKRVDHIITVNEAIKSHLALYWKIPESKVTYIPNGIDLSNFSIERNCDILKKYDIPSRYCLFVGHLIRRKGITYLLEALDKIPNISCVVVGVGPERYRLIRFFKKLEYQGKVISLGGIPYKDLISLYKRAEFLVLPSISEAFPTVILEAMASGIPIVAFDLPGLRRLVINGYNGFLVPPRNVEKLSEKIRFLFENKSVCNIMGRNAQKIASKYDWSNIAKMIIKVYEFAASPQLKRKNIHSSLKHVHMLTRHCWRLKNC